MPDTFFTPGVQTFSLSNGGSGELMIAADQSRAALFIQPVTEATLVNFGFTAGARASGTLTFGANPDPTETIDVNGTVFTYVAGVSTSTNVHIGATKEETAVNFIAVLNASVVAGVALATYTLSAAIVTVTADAGGTDGNGFTLNSSSGGKVVRSGANLTGGSNTVGGIYLAQYASLMMNASEFPSIKNDVYVVSPTDAAKIQYLLSNG